MGTAYFIVLEEKIPGLDTFMNGKSLARHIGPLDKAARALGVRPPSKFFSADPNQMSDFLEDHGLKRDRESLPALQQFTPEEGLTTVRALLAHPVSQIDGVADAWSAESVREFLCFSSAWLISVPKLFSRA
jgi:hypothetical protein